MGLAFQHPQKDFNISMTQAIRPQRQQLLVNVVTWSKTNVHKQLNKRFHLYYMHSELKISNVSFFIFFKKEFLLRAGKRLAQLQNQVNTSVQINLFFFLFLSLSKGFFFPCAWMIFEIKIYSSLSLKVSTFLFMFKCRFFT